MTLTVRLDDTLRAALERLCAERGVTKSLVVQESLARYLLAEPGTGAARADAAPTAARAIPVTSASFQAFANAGLVGAAALGGGTADKAAVRARAAERLRRGTPR